MIDYSNWERKEFNVMSLQLDPLNPRISGLGLEEMNQPTLIARFVQNYGIYDLAKSIAENGYFPDETIIVFKDDKNRYVLEGNRRITALKLLLNPEAAPENEKNKFRKISASVDKSLIEKVYAVIAPSRAEATPLILEKHTITPVKPWSVLMKAAFVKDVFDRDSQIKPEEIGISQNEFRRFLKMDRMYRLACLLDLPDDVYSKIRNKEKFEMTTLERAYDTPAIRKALGLSDDYENIDDWESFKQLYSSIIIDIGRGTQTSRTLDSKDERETYAGILKGRAPKIKKKQPCTVIEVLKKEKPKAKTIKEEAKPKRRLSIRISKGIIPPSFAYRLPEGASLRKLCDELKKLDTKVYSNTASIAFRIFLEKSIKIFLKMNHIKKIPFTQRKPQPDQENISVEDAQLADLLNYIGKQENSIIPDKNVKKNIREFRNGRSYPSLGSLNSIIHNEEKFISPEQAKELWPSLERLFIMMLSETGDDHGQLQKPAEIPGRETESL